MDSFTVYSNPLKTGFLQVLKAHKGLLLLVPTLLQSFIMLLPFGIPFFLPLFRPFKILLSILYETTIGSFYNCSGV
ncbi:hypothetical protein OAD60_00150 [Candidatus Thioglobus sp.]|nr:hypothetical protein [Candidatus Thioglobus sp.]